MDYSQYKQLEFRRKFWKLMGAEVKITEPDSEQVLGVIKMKAWKLKEDIRLFAGESQTDEVMRIGARSVIDFGATYDVFEDEKSLFSFRRKGLRSTFLRDHWDIYNPEGVVIGFVQETSGILALCRRWLGDYIGLILMFVPQTYTINMNTPSGVTLLAARITHRKNPFIVKMNLDFTEAQAQADPRLGVAAASLLSIIDAVKN